MSVLSQFNTPANVQDFSDDTDKQQLLITLWSANVNRWVEAALIGDMWDRINYGPRPAFYNPLQTDTPTGSGVVNIAWNAFPGRIFAYFPNQSGQWNEWADNGGLPEINTNLCASQTCPGPPPSLPYAYTPTGPRGWQDEYCEWSVTRDANNKITSVMFTCENPEYWLTLWQVDPSTVCKLYQDLVNPNVQLSDLYLYDSNNNPVVDPTTGRPAYNPLNKWNSGTQTLPTQGGAMHLTSSPNTLGAEFDLAAAGSMPRVCDGQQLTSASALVCCALYGRIGRHSDPTIGQQVNATVNNPSVPGIRATLTNPVGLYMQTPDFSQYQTPDGTPASTFWTIMRGTTKDPSNPNDIDRILHATFAVPASYGYTVSDITINNQPIQYASQITATITMKLSATAFVQSGFTQPAVACTEYSDATQTVPAASLLQDLAVFTASRAVEQAANELPLSIPVLSFPVTPGTTVSNVALFLNTGDAPQNATISVSGTGVTITITGSAQVPAQGGPLETLVVSIAVASDAEVGDRGIIVTVPGQPTSQYQSLGLLNVVAAPTTVTPATVQRVKPHFIAGRG